MNRYLTSADRALIARITDLAIDVTGLCKYLVETMYDGAQNKFTIRVNRRRFGPRTVNTIASSFHLEIPLGHYSEQPEDSTERTHTLTDAAKFLESLLETPEAPTC